MPLTPYSKTLDSIMLATHRLCGDAIPNGSHYDGRIWRWQEVAYAINRATLEAVDRAGGLRSARVIPLTEGVGVYDLPEDCLRLLRVNMHGMDGWIVLPTSLTELDLAQSCRVATGDPVNFYREFLKSNQIGVLPIPGRDGSTFDRDSPYGLLRQVKDEDGNLMPFDDNLPLRGIRGVPFERSGDGSIIREIISPYGNLSIHYVRSPAKMVNLDDYPDSGIPEWFHRYLAYGASVFLMRYRRDKLSQMKVKIFGVKWSKATRRLQTQIEYAGPMSNAIHPV
jgi:hypothetical protein